MKKVFALILVLWAALPCWAEDPAYTDIDAEAYIYNRGITDRTEIERIHAWYRGLKNLQLYTNVVHMASLRSQHGAVSNSTTIFPMVGGVITLTGGVTQTTNGLYYTNSTSDYASFANPLGTNLSAFTMIAAFASVGKGSQQALLGSWDSSSLKGPQMFLNGSPSAGSTAHTFYNFVSADGSTVPNGETANAGLYGGQNITGSPQFAAFSVSTNGYRFVSGVWTNYTTSTNISTIWNMNASMYLGRLKTANYAFLGTIALDLIFDKNLNQYEIDAVRRLYSKTLGKGYMPESIVIYEGDSLTAGASTEFTYPRHLFTNTLWGPRVLPTSFAVSGAQYSGVVGRFTNSCRPLLVDKDYARDIWFSAFVGANDIATGTSATSAFDSVKAIWQMARDAGMKVIAWTILPSGGMTPAADTQRKLYNNLILQNRGSYDRLVDIAGTDPFRENSITNSSTYFQSDHIHLTTDGHKLLAEKLGQVINEP